MKLRRMLALSLVLMALAADDPGLYYTPRRT